MTIAPVVSKSIWLETPEHTERLGATLARAVTPGAVLYLQGELGAGKTTFVRGLLTALGHRGIVRSPTYTLIEPYQLAHHALIHCDLYRLRDPEELDFIGLRDFADQQTLWLIEWPEKGAGYLPAADLLLALFHQVNGRRCEGYGYSDSGIAMLHALNTFP